MSPVGPPRCSFSNEEGFWGRGVERVAGVDEAGRGPLAGPVVAAAVVFLERVDIPALDDSKRLSARKRERLYDQLTADARIAWGIGWQEAAEIDRLNILRATHAAMAVALGRLDGVQHALVDGLPVPGLPVPHTALVGGDGRSLSIAAASIIAKVTRDRLMDGWHARYPEYGFDRHRGYPTAAHISQLRIHGPCPIHRRSFAPVADCEAVA